MFKNTVRALLISTWFTSMAQAHDGCPVSAPFERHDEMGVGFCCKDGDSRDPIHYSHCVPYNDSFVSTDEMVGSWIVHIYLRNADGSPRLFEDQLKLSKDSDGKISGTLTVPDRFVAKVENLQIGHNEFSFEITADEGKGQFSVRYKGTLDSRGDTFSGFGTAIAPQVELLGGFVGQKIKDPRKVTESQFAFNPVFTAVASGLECEADKCTCTGDPQYDPSHYDCWKQTGEVNGSCRLHQGTWVCLDVCAANRVDRCD